MEDDLKALGGAEDAAREAFVRITPSLVRFLRGALRDRLSDRNAREEVVVDALAKLWSARKSFQYEDLERWWSYVRTAARTSAFDHYRRRRNEVPWEWTDEEPAVEERPLIEGLARAALLRRAYAAADGLWLGISTETCPNLEDRILAMQLHYDSGTRPDVTAALAGASSRAELDEWLADDAALLAWAYREFYMANEPLCAAILGCEEGDVERMAARTGEPPQGWTWSEVLCVVRRFRNGLKDEQILRFSDCGHTLPALTALWDRCRALLPVEESAPRFRRALDDRRARVVAESGLWRRLALQYEHADSLPLKQTHERIVPAQRPFKKPMSLEALSMWISGARLVDQLTAYIARGGR